jgi:hypothetical protein
MRTIIDAVTGVITIDESFVSAPPDPEQVRAQWRAGRVLRRTQLALALISDGLLSEAEAEEFAGHNLPAPIVATINNLPEAVRVEARIKMRGAQEFHRADPLWTVLVASDGDWTDERIDQVFGWQE